MTIPAAVQDYKNKQNAGIWFERIDLTLTNGNIIRFSNNTETVTINSNEYIPLPFTATGLEQIADSALPTRQLICANQDISALLVPHIKDQNGLRGATCVITKVLYEQLAADMSDLSQTYTVMNCEVTEETIAINLGMASPAQQPIPLMRYRYTLCRSAKDFKGPRCGYTGHLETCDGTLASCIARSNQSRFDAELNLRPKVSKWI